MGAPSWPYWLVSIALHVGFFSLVFFQWETEVLEYEALRVDIALNQAPSARQNPRPRAALSEPSPSPDDSLWQVDPLDSQEYEEMGWEAVKPLSQGNKIERFGQLGIMPESFHQNADVPDFEEIEDFDDILEPIPVVQARVSWSLSDLAGSGSPLPDLNSLGIYSTLVMDFEIILENNGVIRDIIYQESGNLELDLRLLEYIRGLRFPVNPEGIAYTQKLVIRIVLEEGW
jgi:hypothetical protein